jgi:hypothetical protein
MMILKNNIESKPIFMLYWLTIAILLLLIDYFSGPFIQFPISYLIPVALAAWYNGRWWGLSLAVTMPLVRLYFNIDLWTVPWTMFEAVFNTLIKMAVLASFALIIDRNARQTNKLNREVNLLEGLLPVCSFCKKIRDDQDQWQPIEKYIMARSPVAFSHGVCPECVKKYYGAELGEKK